MKIESASFKDDEGIPEKYGCAGENISPQLSWSDFPEETKSFALICRDPDAPNSDFVHWIVADIPKNVTEVSEEAMKIDEAQNITNDFGKTEYGGPCPPSGTHRYFFTIYALNSEKIEGINRDDFDQKIKPYIIDQAQIMGKYQK